MELESVGLVAVAKRLDGVLSDDASETAPWGKIEDVAVPVEGVIAAGTSRIRRSSLRRFAQPDRMPSDFLAAGIAIDLCA